MPPKYSKITEGEVCMSEEKIFKLESPYKPTGDQPQAIEQLVKGFKEGNQCQTLLGATGSGKTFTMANVIAQLNRPTLVIEIGRASCRERVCQYV